MTPTIDVTINAFLASIPDDFNFEPAAESFLEKQCLNLFAKAGTDPKEVLLIPYAESELGCLPYVLASAQSILDNRKVTCISKGYEKEMIMSAEAVIVTGGKIKNLETAAQTFGEELWERILGGMPYIGINAGAEFLSSVYMSGIDSTNNNLNFFPFQFFANFDGNVQQDFDRVIDFFADPNFDLKYLVGLPKDTTNKEGSGLVIENSKAGLAGGNKVNSGDPPNQHIKDLFLYKKEPDGSPNRLNPPIAQIDHLPIDLPDINIHPL